MVLTVGSFLFFTAMVAVIVYLLVRRDPQSTSDDYFLGGRQLTAWVIAGSLILTNLSTEHLIGLNADAFNHTIAVMAWETTSALAMIVTALFFLPRYLKRGLTTIPDFLAERFDRQTAFIATILFLFSYVIAILPVVLLFGATGVESLFGISESFGIGRVTTIWILVWMIGGIGSIYAIFGGLRAVALSDTINGVGFLLMGLLIPILGLLAIGQGDLFEGVNELYTSEPEKFDITGDEPGSFLPFSVLFTGMIINQLFFWGANQSIVQRALAAKNLKEGQKGVLIAAWFKLLAPVIIVLPGVIAFYMFKDELGAGDAARAYPMLVNEVLPPALRGVFAAVMVGAILSTFNSVLNSSATLFSKNIYAAMSKDPTEKQVVVSGRMCSIVLAVGAMLLAPLIDTSGSLYNYLQITNATFFGPMFAVILMGYLTKNTSAISAKAGLIVGPIIFLLVVFIFGEQTQALLKTMFNLSHDVHFLHFLAFIFLLTVALMGMISVFSPAKTIYVPRDSHAVDMTPWKWGRLNAVLLAGATILCYVLLAR
ncbi:MAG: solute:sodium symporter family transporter [Hyphomonas sp.]|nr:solute:sodium symporter family transporter [Hyphomonas sp.]